MPYREAEILLPCPRCGASLVREEKGRQARCLNGCGDFVTEHGLREQLVDDLHLARPFSMWWKATATACPSCKAPMRAMILGDVKLYRCTTHGAWFDSGSSPVAETLVRAQQTAVRNEVQAREAQPSEAQRLAEALIDGSEHVALLIVQRLLSVEERVRLLESELKTLRDELAEARRSR